MATFQGFYLVFKNSHFMQSGSRTLPAFRMQLFVALVNGRKPLTNVIKSTIFDVAVVLDTPMPRNYSLLLQVEKSYSFI